MNKTALVISLVSLCLASVAYWRSGGKQDVQALGREVEGLRASTVGAAGFAAAVKKAREAKEVQAVDIGSPAIFLSEK